MKKILSILLLICALISLSSCSSSPVAFSDKLFNGRECYIDVVEITPQSYVNDPLFLYCQCKLNDGDVVWMEISPDNYVKYFDNEADAEDISFTARKVTYNDSVRINGEVKKVKNIFEDNSSGKVKIFKFEGVEDDLTSKIDTITSTAIEFSEGLRDNTVVYTDVISIDPKYPVSSIFTSTPDHVVCECKTADGKTVWLFISIDNYHEFLDASASFKIDYINPSKAEKLEFAEPVRFFGITAKRADKFSVSTQGAEISEQIVEFKNADKEQVEAAKIGNQSPVMYTGDQKINQQVYVDITHITPQYVSYYYNILQYIICECTTANGKSVWVAIHNSKYESDFFADYADSIGIKKALNNKTRILGRIETADEISSDLDSKINQDTIIIYNGME